MKNLIALKLAKNEKDVENAWRIELKRELKNCNIISPYGTDGLVVGDKNNKIRCLCEFKHHFNLQEKSDVAKILCQIIFYLKKFDNANDDIPNVIFVGDDNECFVIHANKLTKYLDKQGINWSIAPSSAWSSCPELYKDILLDNDVNPLVFNVDDKFSIVSVVDQITVLSIDPSNRWPISPHNVLEAFDYWKSYVLAPQNITAQEEVGAFMKCLIDRTNTYLHPNKPNVLIVTSNDGSSREIKLKKSKDHVSFFEYFKQDYTVEEKRNLTAVKDRLVADETRRMTGEFFTPKIWVDEAHRRLDEQLGSDWRDKYIVWDASCGTANLTRDYKFKELYLSTLNEEDVDCIKTMGFNAGATVFQYDFLNDDLDKLPTGLLDALKENKPIVFLNNPPYGGNGAGHTKAVNKKGSSRTKVGDRMRKAKMGLATQQLFTHFMWKLSEIQYKFKLQNAVIGLFSGINFITSSSYVRFRDDWLSRWSFTNGMMFCSNSFNGTSGNGEIIFSVWNSKSNISQIKLDLMSETLIKNSFQSTTIILGSKTINSAKTNINLWIKPTILGNKTECLPLRSALCANDVNKTSFYDNCFGYLVCHTPSIGGGQTGTNLFSSIFHGGHGCVISSQNIFRTSVYFTARRLIQPVWYNQKDEFSAPNEADPNYQRWVNDALIFSLFESRSSQSSLRQVTYKGKLWDIKNEFFWMSNVEMKDLANKIGFMAMYNDAALNNQDRFVYQKLQGLDISDDAKDILETALSTSKRFNAVSYHST